jgi:hypothetical protein
VSSENERAKGGGLDQENVIAEIEVNGSGGERQERLMPGNSGDEVCRVELRGRQAADIRLGLEESLLPVGNDKGANLERRRGLRAVILL